MNQLVHLDALTQGAGIRRNRAFVTLAPAFGVPGDERVRGLFLGGSVLLGLDVLRNQPGFESIPEGKTWLQVDPDTVGTSDIAQRDPSSSLDALRGASVLDASCQSHTVEGLYVLDCSFMPTAGASNPTLTLLANAYRVCESVPKA